MEDEIKETTPVYDRSALQWKRKKQEIGIQALRGGTIFGEHEIMFAGLDEIIEIKHTDFIERCLCSRCVSCS